MFTPLKSHCTWDSEPATHEFVHHVGNGVFRLQIFMYGSDFDNK